MSKVETDPEITRIQPMRPQGLRVRIHLTHGDALEAALEALEKARLGVGDILTPSTRRALLQADTDVRIREAALHQLSYRARTRAELRKRLLRKDFPAARVDICLTRLQERGLLDDADVAAAFVRDRVRLRPKGSNHLAQELRGKGVGGDLATEVVERVLRDEGVSDNDLARRVADGWVGRQPASLLDALASCERTPERDKARRRLHGYLARRGFRGAALHEAMERAVGQAVERAGAQAAEQAERRAPKERSPGGL